MLTEKPILLLLFNRPDHTQQLFNALERVKPRHLYIACDGPRPSRPSDIELTQLVRQIATNIPWECKTEYRFLSSNLGMMNSVYSSISWFFENVESGIILEDDCIPSPSFFHFCHLMLDRYQNSNSVFSISGRNHLGEFEPNAQYFFSTGSIWGWATWRRAWCQFNLSNVFLKSKAELEHDLLWLKEIAPNKYTEIVNGVLRSADGTSPTWDYPWAYVRMAKRSLNVISSFNLVRNIGSGDSATNTSSLADSVPVHNPSFSDSLPYAQLQLNYDYIAALDTRRKQSNVFKTILKTLILRLTSRL